MEAFFLKHSRCYLPKPQATVIVLLYSAILATFAKYFHTNIFYH